MAVAIAEIHNGKHLGLCQLVKDVISGSMIETFPSYCLVEVAWGQAYVHLLLDILDLLLFVDINKAVYS